MESREVSKVSQGIEKAGAPGEALIVNQIANLKFSNPQDSSPIFVVC